MTSSTSRLDNLAAPLGQRVKAAQSLSLRSIDIPVATLAELLAALNDDQAPAADDDVETPLTEQLFVDLLSLPSLGSTRATVRFTDLNDGQAVTITGRAINIGLGPQLKANTRREARDRVSLEIALPLPAELADSATPAPRTAGQPA